MYGRFGCYTKHRLLAWPCHDILEIKIRFTLAGMELVEEEGVVRKALSDPYLGLFDTWVRSECDTNLFSDTAGLSATFTPSLSSSVFFKLSLK